METNNTETETETNYTICTAKDCCKSRTSVEVMIFFLLFLSWRIYLHIISDVLHQNDAFVDEATMVNSTVMHNNSYFNQSFPLCNG